MELIRGVILLIMSSIFIFVFVVLIDDAIMNRTKKKMYKEVRLNRLMLYFKEKAEFKKAWREEYEKIKTNKKARNNENE
jgi:ABC-type lipoprotein release transport system permease subunit